jgi:hypothetical protein
MSEAEGTYRNKEERVASGGRRLITEEEVARKGEEGDDQAAVGRWGGIDPKVGNGIERLGERWDGLLLGRAHRLRKSVYVGSYRVSLVGLSIATLD